MKSNKIVMIVVLLLLTGCAPKVTIMLDGLPAPTRTYVMSNPATNLQVELTISKWHRERVNKKNILRPEYMALNKEYFIDANKVEFLELCVKTHNPNGVWYTIEKYLDGRPLRVFEGHDNAWRALVIRQSVLEEGPHRISIVFKDKGGFNLMKLGEVLYETKVRKEEVVN